MMQKIYNWIIAGIVIILLFLTISAHSSTPKVGGGTYNQSAEYFAQGLFAGFNNQLAIGTDGSIALTATGTSTASFLSSSTTKGFCINLNATSSATRLNLTATTTTNATGTQSGLVLAYGACQ